MRLNPFRQNPYRQVAEPKRRSHRMRTIRALAATAMLGSVGLTAYAGWLWQDSLRVSLRAEIMAATAHAGLRLERIEITGRLNTSKAEIQKAIATEWYSPIHAADLAAIHGRIAALGWVHSARVERRLPNTLIIAIHERMALALFQDDQGHHVIDRSGEVIAGVAAQDFTHLPVVKGEGAPAEAQAIITLLKEESDLFAQVWSLTYQSKRRWDVYLRNNIRVQLPEDNPGEAWARLAEIDRQRQITHRNITNIDLRIPEKLVIRTAPIGQKGSNT